MRKFLCKLGIHNCVRLVADARGEDVYKCIKCGKLTIVKVAPKCCK